MEERDYLLFDDYTAGSLSQKGNADFKVRLKNDQAFKRAYDTYLEATAFLTHHIGKEEENTAFKNNLKKISNRFFDQKKDKKTHKNFRPYRFAIAASIVLLLGYFTWHGLSSPTYSDYNAHQPLSLTVRGGQVELMAKAEEAFNTKNYREAIQYLDDLLAENPNNNELSLYKGIALLEQDDFVGAEAMFSALAEGPSIFKNKALWYLALSKLKQKEYRACAEILKTLPTDADDYGQAQKLLKKLD